MAAATAARRREQTRQSTIFVKAEKERGYDR